MKARPRRVENRVAEELTKWSAERGDHWVFKRWPAMGRIGPDIYFPNPYRFVIDAKSRKSISNKPFHITNMDREVKWWVHDGEEAWYICRLDHLEVLFDMDWKFFPWHSVVVSGWLEKMRDWGEVNGGVGMLVLHKPRKPIGSSVVVISANDWLRLMEAMNLI